MQVTKYEEKKLSPSGSQLKKAHEFDHSIVYRHAVLTEK
jgi:hypothetical protein